MKKISLAFVFLIAHCSIGQNPSYILADSAFRLMSSGEDIVKSVRYREGLNLWRELNKKYSVDPEKKSSFLYYSWDNKDYTSFKETLEELVRNYGFTKEDLERRRQIYDELRGNAVMAGWFDVMYTKNRKIYLGSNAENIWLIQKCKDYFFMTDRLLNEIVNTFRRSGKSDTLLLSHLDTVRQKLAWEIYKDLFETCNKNHFLPNNFDCHDHTVSANLSQVISLNLSIPYKTEEKWILMKPYLESAFRAGKISPVLFLYFNDLYWYASTGYQYYGLLDHTRIGSKKPIEIKDRESVNERRAKYGLKPLEQ